MKINLFPLLILIGTGFSSCETDVVVPAEKTPQEIRNYVSLHFPGKDIRRCELERDGLSRTFEIDLSGDVYLEFNRKFRVTEIDSDSRIPDGALPEKPRQYVAGHYSDHYITDWSLNDYGNQELGLENGTVLEFSNEGSFIQLKN